MTMVQPKMTPILQAKKWSSIASIHNLEKLTGIAKTDICTILMDTKGSEPEVLKVSNDVFSGQPHLLVDIAKFPDVETLLGTLLLESDEEFMTCLRQSQIDKKNGRTRKYKDIAKECGLDI